MIITIYGYATYTDALIAKFKNTVNSLYLYNRRTIIKYIWPVFNVIYLVLNYTYTKIE